MNNDGYTKSIWGDYSKFPSMFLLKLVFVLSADQTFMMLMFSVLPVKVFPTLARLGD